MPKYGLYRNGTAGVSQAVRLATATRTDVLNPNMLRTLAAVMGHFEENRHAATLEEICRRLGRQRRNNNAVIQTLSRLQRLGLITRDPHTARSIRPACRFFPARKS